MTTAAFSDEIRTTIHTTRFPEAASPEHMAQHHPNAPKEFGSSVCCSSCGARDLPGATQAPKYIQGRDGDLQVATEDGKLVWEKLPCEQCGQPTKYVESKSWEEQTPDERQQNHVLDHTGGWYGFQSDPTDHMHVIDVDGNERVEVR